MTADKRLLQVQGPHMTRTHDTFMNGKTYQRNEITRENLQLDPSFEELTEVPDYSIGQHGQQ